MRADRDPLISQIRRFNPASLVVHMTDGESRPVAISPRKNRWEQLLALLSSLPWERVECIGRDASLVGVVDNPDAGNDDQEDEQLDDRKYFAALIRDVHREAVKETANQYNAQMGAFRELTASVLGVVKLQQDTHRHAMQVQAQAAAAKALAGAAGDDDDDGSNELMKLFGMMQMMKAGPIPRPPTSPTPATPPPQPPRESVRKPDVPSSGANGVPKAAVA